MKVVAKVPVVALAKVLEPHLVNVSRSLSCERSTFPCLMSFVSNCLDSGPHFFIWEGASAMVVLGNVSWHFLGGAMWLVRVPTRLWAAIGTCSCHWIWQRFGKNLPLAC